MSAHPCAEYTTIAHLCAIERYRASAVGNRPVSTFVQRCEIRSCTFVQAIEWTVFGFRCERKKGASCQQLIRGVVIRFEGPNNVELLSWCRGILDRLDKLARDRLLAIGNNN